MRPANLARAAVLALIAVTFSLAAWASSTQRSSSKSRKISESSKVSAKKRTRPVVSASKTRRPVRRRRRYYVHYNTSSYADDVTWGDISTGEDAVVRAAAEEALGNMNGTVVAVDPASGRVLTMVNQKLALSEGAKPCSTIKVAVALAALKEIGRASCRERV